MRIQKKTMIGGQAVFEGIAMRGPKYTTLACRIPSGEIDLERFENKTSHLANTPLLRGIVKFVQMLVDGYKFLSISMEKSGLFEDEAGKKEEKPAFKSLLFILGTVLGIGISVCLFIWLPQTLTHFVMPVSNRLSKVLFEGIFKIGILILYFWLVSQTKDMKKIFMYHGAEHKAISCYESGQEICVSNAKNCSRLHPRCGTSFLLITLLISMLVSLPLRWDNAVLRVISKISLIPLVVGVSYELIRFAGQSDSAISKLISKPGLWLQRITTKEPSDQQLEVAIAAFNDLLPLKDGEDDWR